MRSCWPAALHSLSRLGGMSRRVLRRPRGAPTACAFALRATAAHAGSARLRSKFGSNLFPVRSIQRAFRTAGLSLFRPVNAIVLAGGASFPQSPTRYVTPRARKGTRRANRSGSARLRSKVATLQGCGGSAPPDHCAYGLIQRGWRVTAAARQRQAARQRARLPPHREDATRRHRPTVA